MSTIPQSTTPRTDAAVRLTIGAGFNMVYPSFARELENELVAMTARAEKAEFDLAHARVMVRVLRDACGIIERKAGEDYDERDPLSDVGDIATKALAATKEASK
jgi:hypothetical protein